MCFLLLAAFAAFLLVVLIVAILDKIIIVSVCVGVLYAFLKYVNYRFAA